MKMNGLPYKGFSNAIMEKSILLLLLLFITSLAVAQRLTQEASLPREGDELSKIRLDYTTSGMKGWRVLWDFSGSRDGGIEDCKVRYTGKTDSIFYLLDSRTRYSYKLSSDSLLSIGYENANLRSEYLLPEVFLRYPFQYGDSIGSCFYGKGSYSHSLPFSSYGLSSTVADGMGCLKLPGGDTLQNVLRLRQERYIGQRYLDREAKDSGSFIYSPDSIRHWLQNDSVTWHVIHCQWYAPGYRYPVFETFENSIYQSGTLNRHFNTASYYPPIEQHYLKNDPVNQDIREQLAVAKEKELADKDKEATFYDSNYSNLSLLYSLSPENQLTLKYQIADSVQLELILTTVSGIVLYHQPVCTMPMGVYTKEIDLSACADNEFILCTIVNGRQESLKIIRR